MDDKEKDSLVEVLKVLIDTANVSSITIRLKPTTAKEPKSQSNRLSKVGRCKGEGDLPRAIAL